MLKEMFRDVKQRDRQCVVAYDEMSVDFCVSYDPKHDRIDGPHKKLLVVAVRGQTDPWKQPVFYGFDQKLTKELFYKIITAVEEASLNVIGFTSDLATTNRGLLKDIGGITAENPNFQNPVTKYPIWVIADFPHLIKLLKNNIVDHGFVLSNGKNIGYHDFKELINLNKHELTACFKLSDLHIDARGKDRMNVALAFELLSDSTAKAFEKYLPWKSHVAEFVKLVNDASDLLNSRFPEDLNPLKTGYGVHITEQNKILDKFEHEIATMRPLKADGTPAKSMLPFQKGLLMTIRSVKGIYSQMKSLYNAKYILTARLNQDFIENIFSRIRGLGVFNQNPSPIECAYRLKSLVLSRTLNSPKSCSVSSEERWGDSGTFKGEILNYLKQNHKAAEDDENWAKDLIEAEFLMKIIDYDPEIEELNPDNWADFNDRMSIQEHCEFGGQEYFFGFIASKMKDKFYSGVQIQGPDLNRNPISWTQHISGKNLTTPSYDFLNLCRNLNVHFLAFHESDDKWSINRVSGVTKLLTQGLVAKFPTVDEEIIRYFVRTRTFLRINFINSRLKKRSQSAYIQRVLKSNPV